MLRTSVPYLEVVEIDEDHVKGVAYNLVMMVWRRRTMVVPYRAGMQLVVNLGLKHPNGVGVMQVVETEAIPPDSEARKAFAEFVRLPQIRHFSVTHEGTGFKAASVRAIVSGVNALARPSFVHSVQSTVADASRWAAAQNRLFGARDDAKAIEAALQALRRLHVERYPSPR